MIDVVTFRHDLLGGLRHMREPATQRRWDAFLRAVYGLPLDDEGLGWFREHTGREVPRPGGYPEAVVITGRQSGKTQTAGDLLAYHAATAGPEMAGTYALAIAQDARGAMRSLLRYATAPFDGPGAVPMLAREVVGRTADSLTLANGVTLAAYPCRPSSVRGIRACVAVVDELAFFRTSDGNPVDVEMLRAVRPTLATTGGKLIVLSSPYSQTGALWDLHRRHTGREESETLVWSASAAAMNGTLPADYLARMAEDDPEAYRAEVLGEFRAGTSTLFDPDALDACVRHGTRDLLPAPGVSYAAFADPSSGAPRGDAFCIAIGHADERGAVVDAVRAWTPPFSIQSVVAEAAHWLRSYGIRDVTGDRYAGEIPRAIFGEHGVHYALSAQNRSELYLDMLPLVQAGAVELPDDPQLLRELRGIERRRGFGGRDRCDHRAGAHDDRGNSAAGVVSLIGPQRARPAGTIEVHGY